MIASLDFWTAQGQQGQGGGQHVQGGGEGKGAGEKF